MGSFSDFVVAGYRLFSAKNGYYKDIVNLIFLNEDYVSEKYIDPDDEEERTFLGFKQTASICRQRLEIYGHNLKSAKKNFAEAKKHDQQESELGYYYNITFERYLELIRIIIANNIRHKVSEEDHVANHLIEFDLVLYETLSMPTILYCLFSVIDDDAIIQYDLSYIVDNWVSYSSVVSITPEKIIILTEGKTDSEFISKSLKATHPQLYPYYHFIDFEEYKLESNASMLGKLITAFAAANIKHHFIALFDNDATGVMEFERVRQHRLNLTQRVLKLPDLKLARNYPTIGPSGKKKMNINGRACAIELYLGKDVLTDGDGLLPVQWTALNPKTNLYQGEIANKAMVHDRFRQKLKQEKLSGMEEMDELLHTIFNAFN
jgi:hypothetical protein